MALPWTLPLLLTLAVSGLERHLTNPEVVLRRGFFLGVALVWNKSASA